MREIERKEMREGERGGVYARSGVGWVGFERCC